MNKTRLLSLVAFTVLLPAGFSGCATDEDEGLSVETVRQRATVCEDGPVLVGVDVSKYQGNVDWEAVRADGVDYAFARVSDGLNSPDAYFASNWSGIKAAGLIRGAYQYFRPAQNVAAQAQLMLDRIGVLEAGDLAPVIDVETASGLSASTVAAKVREWISIVETATGRRPIVYTGPYFWRDQVGGADMLPSPLWVAHYGAECPLTPAPWTRWSFWQYTDSGRVDGITGNVDTNIFNGDIDALLGLAAPAECGDGICSVGETTSSCAVDCPPCGVVDVEGGSVDDGDACFSTGGPDQFIRHVTDAGNDSDLRWTNSIASSSEANYGEWDLFLLEAGLYRVEVYTDASYAESMQARYLVDHNATSDSVVIDQTAVDGWQSLGDFEFAAGGDQRVHLGDNTGVSSTALVFDTVKLTRLDLGSTGCDTCGGDDDSDDSDNDVSARSAGCSATGSNSSGSAGLLGMALLAVAFRRRRSTKAQRNSN